TGDLSGEVTVEFGITPDGATPGVDFDAPALGTVTFAAGEDRVTVPVAVLDDDLGEPSESFVVSLINVDSGFLQAPRTARVTILDDENPVTDPATPPLTSPYDVSELPVVTGLTQPIAFEFSPTNANRIYVAEKAGVIKAIDLDNNNAVTTVLDIRAEVNNRQDRGLLDIAIDPNFPDQPFIYASYVVDPPQSQGQGGNAGPDGGGNRFMHIVRYELDETGTGIVPGSETILAGGAGQNLSDISGGGAVDSTSNRTQAESGVDPQTGAYIDDYIAVDSRSHAGGALAFGPDGALYISVGDGTSFNFADPRSARVQDINSLSGKVLRIDPETGLGLPDNPFVEDGMDLSSNAARVYQLGLRNPFSMGFDGDGQLFITDTGWFTFEEVNAGPAGANFGWPWFEGGDSGVDLRTPNYRNLPEA
ncbi:MAG: PQQ-dependent sugar dehydrogenase, partial [Pseudomonadota bacterium]